ncbi:MAG: electron transfer flavoprotein subunit beta/FixA family protein [Thermodesulfobacteriota bacterium]
MCVKHVPDTAATIRIKADGHIDENITFIMNPYDENAVEEAVRLKKQTSDAEVIAISLGKESAEATLRSAMAMGADRGILIKSATDHDSLSTARSLCSAIQADGAPDVIFTGREAIDSEGFQTMFHLGAFLGFPAVSNAVAFELSGTSVKVTCEMEAGNLEHVQMDMPCVIGAGKDLNQPSYPKLPDILKARNKPITVLELSDLEMELPASRVEMVGIEPLKEERQPDNIEGTVDEIAGAMVKVLRDKAKVLDG